MRIAICSSLVNVEAYDGELIRPYEYPPDCLVYRKYKISVIPSLSQDICTRTQLRDVPADSKYSAELRIVGASNHQ